jgi:hypothetical protein
MQPRLIRESNYPAENARQLLKTFFCKAKYAGLATPWIAYDRVF